MSAQLSANVTEAARCDSSGNHARAVSLLAEASAQGDVEAMTRLGKRLLVAANAPDRPKEGTELIRAAAELGGAEAAAQLAVLSAIGMFVNQSWEAALAALTFAAERGWPAARRQLRILTADRDLAAQPQLDSAAWRRLAGTIDLAQWHAPAAGATLSESPLVRHFPAFASAEVCEWLIEKSRGRLVRAPVYSQATRTEAISETRTNTWAMFNVLEADLVSVLVQVRMCATTGLAFRYLEPLSVLHYAVGEEITEHFDFVDPARTPNYDQELRENGQRVVTFLIYLNDDYADGKTEMAAARLSHKGQRGEGLYFVNAHANGDPDRRTLHAGRPPTQGEKWIVSQFMRDLPLF
ncbi:MAG TPA: 2OG-Fe(II) oxygenase [Gammaproteobacteria bacterium]|nr:2OG-Fe(II) oxygenase [Gammaproteobacteria bacterium]